MTTDIISPAPAANVQNAQPIPAKFTTDSFSLAAEVASLLHVVNDLLHDISMPSDAADWPAFERAQWLAGIAKREAEALADVLDRV